MSTVQQQLLLCVQIMEEINEGGMNLATWGVKQPKK